MYFKIIITHIRNNIGYTTFLSFIGHFFNYKNFLIFSLSFTTYTFSIKINVSYQCFGLNPQLIKTNRIRHSTTVDTDNYNNTTQF